MAAAPAKIRVITPIESTAGKGAESNLLETKPDIKPEQRIVTRVRYSAPAREFAKNPEAIADIKETERNTRADRATERANAGRRPISLKLLLFIKKSPENLS